MTQAVALAQQASTGVSQGFKNRIINGAMVIDQRNAGASVTQDTSGTQFPLDRWLIYGTVNSKFSVQQNAGSVTPPAGFSNYFGATSLSAYSVGAGDYFTFQQRIEGFNFADCNWGSANAKNVTLSFWVRSSLTGTFGGSLSNSAFDRSYPFSYTISSANTWEQKSITIAGDTTGTWIGATNGTGLRIVFSLGSGSTYSATAGAWTAGTYISATGATSVVGTNGATFYITGVQLEVGSTATSFDYLDYGRTLIQCQRYFEKIGGSQSFDLYTDTYGVSGGACMYCVQYKVTKRANPTATVIGTFTRSGNVGSLYFGNTGVNTCSLQGDVGSTARAYFYNPDTSTYITMSAEL